MAKVMNKERSENLRSIIHHIKLFGISSITQHISFLIMVNTHNQNVPSYSIFKCIAVLLSIYIIVHYYHHPSLGAPFILKKLKLFTS